MMVFSNGALSSFFLICCAGIYTTNAGCSYSQFTCNNGNCVPLSYTCNRLDDCEDNSDEFGCGGCSSYQFRCYNGQCIDSTLACDRKYNCSDNSDESRCSYNCTSGSVRLVGTGSNQASGYGRVEMCYNNAWGTICGDSGWDYSAASVVCTQLGFSGSPYVSSGQYGQGTGKILLSGLTCYGYESTLLNCGHSNSVIGTTSCSHSQDAAVSCYGAMPPTYYYNSFDTALAVMTGLIGPVTIVIIIVVVVSCLCMCRAYRRQANLHRAAIIRNAPAPAAATIVTTITQNNTSEASPAFNPSAGYGSYTAAGYPTYGNPPTGYPSTGYPTTGYSAAPPPYQNHDVKTPSRI